MIFLNKQEILQQTSEIPLSRNNVKDQVLQTANDVNLQLTTDLQKASCYSMCLDESTDINNHARLAVILCYAVGDTMREELLKLISLPGRTQGVDIYNAVMECFLTQGITPAKIVSITTDGAPCKIESTSDFIKLFVNEIKHQVIQFHYITHQEALCTKESSKKLEDVLKDITKIMDYIMACALHVCQFQTFFGEFKV